MAKRAYLVKLTTVSNDLTLNGTWHADIAQQVNDQGGEWAIYTSWCNEGQKLLVGHTDPDQSKGYHALCLVDSAAPLVLTDCYNLNMVAIDMQDAIFKIKQTSIDLPSQAQTALENAGFTIMNGNLYDTIESIINHGN